MQCQGIQIFLEYGQALTETGVKECESRARGGVHEDDSQAVMHENQISKEAAVDRPMDSEGKEKYREK